MTPHSPLYAALHAREFPAQAMLRLRPELRMGPCVVVEGEPPLQRVCSLNAHARAQGVAHGMTRVELDTFDALTILPRSMAEETAARSALLECAGGFSPRVEDRSDGPEFLGVADIAGSERLLGNPETVARSLVERMTALGIAARVTVATNVQAALCHVRGMPGRGWAVIASGDEARVLAPLPLAVLDLAEDHCATFAAWGIQTLGMVAALPETELIARIGQEGKRIRQLARGSSSCLFVPLEPVFRLEERRELEAPVESLDSLLFVAGVLLEQLIVRAAARVLALASVTVALGLEGGATHGRTVRPALPGNDRQLWLKLLHLDLEAHPPPAAILSIALTAEPGKTSKVQLGLFSPQLPEPMRLDVTLARIRAIVGEECVGSPVLQDKHQPDAFRMVPFRVVSGAPQASGTSRTAMRRIRPAENLTMTLHGHRPAAIHFRGTRYAIEHAWGPWKAGGEWWNGAAWEIEEWDLTMCATNGTALCCCVVHDMRQGQWQMAGLYD